MLYDNAQLAKLYTEAWLVTHDPEFRRVAEGILDYIAREMVDPSGAFYSTQNADPTPLRSGDFAARARRASSFCGNWGNWRSSWGSIRGWWRGTR